MTDVVERYLNEAGHIGNACLVAAERHYAAETPWYYSVYWLGIPSTVLSAIAGAAAFSKIANSEVVAGSISITVAIISSLMTFLDPSRKAALYHSIAKSYETLYHDCGYFCRIELREEGLDMRKCSDALKQLSKRMDDLNISSPPIPGRAYRVAERKLAAGRGEVARDPT